MRSRCSSTLRGARVAWMVWLRMTTSKTCDGIFDQVGIGVALNDRQPARHAGVHVLLRQFDAAPVDVLGRRQMFEQRAVAAADVEHARAVRNHFGDGREIGAQRRTDGFMRRRGSPPRN